MNHKRGRPKKQRAGCLHCKPHKGNGVGRAAETVQDRRAVSVEDEIVAYAIGGSEYKVDPPEAMYDELAEITDDFWCFGGSWEGWSRWQ